MEVHNSMHDSRIFALLFQLQGSLMIAGLIHALFGFTGIVGLLLKFVGPLTIVPALVLIFIFIVQPVLKFVVVSWAISMS
jgi:nucleobase transporter 1/2